MPTLDFYAILGVSPSASQEEIRLAHRQLVKRYHPDIYSTSGDKARSTAKLQQINEAYAVLGNVARRKKYDASRSEQRRSAQEARRPQPPPRQAAKTATRRPPLRKRPNFAALRRMFRARWLVIPLVVGLSAAALLGYASQTRLIPVWVLLQKSEGDALEGAGLDARPTTVWKRVATFPSKADCAAILKQRVRQGVQAGGRAIVDDEGGSVGIVVSMDAGGKAETEPPNGSTSAANAANANPAVKRIQHYECRASQIREADSWVKRLLSRTGLSS